MAERVGFELASPLVTKLPGVGDLVDG